MNAAPFALLGMVAAMAARGLRAPRPLWKEKLRTYGPCINWDAERLRLGYEPTEPPPFYYRAALFEPTVNAEPEPVIPAPEWPALPPVPQLPTWWIAMALICRILERLAYAWVALVGLFSLIMIVTTKFGPADSSDFWFLAAVVFGPAFLLEVLVWVLKPPAELR